MKFKEYLNKKIKEDSKFKENYYKKDLTNLLIDIGNEIENKRIQGGIRQNELAKKLRTSQSYISRLENGSLSPSIKMLQKIAEVFGGFVELSIVGGAKESNTINENTGFGRGGYESMYKVISGSVVLSGETGTVSSEEIIIN